MRVSPIRRRCEGAAEREFRSSAYATDRITKMEPKCSTRSETCEPGAKRWQNYVRHQETRMRITRYRERRHAVRMLGVAVGASSPQ
jgi:hypothetical protein